MKLHLPKVPKCIYVKFIFDNPQINKSDMM